MRKNSFISLVVIFFIGLSTQAQSKKWTLEECVNYALENNISIKQSELDTQIASVDKKVTYEIIKLEVDAIKHAISIAEKGTFITALSDVITNAIEVVQQHLDTELEEELEMN